ncbi:hypothetical protein J9E33_002410 [Salmonella enterica]|uniref:hypothetical protein n=1 Tax=Salmonella enterica TaxID=28901 RepID=UPI0009AF9E68|nr:hypothetical protein [Salmonella enterica]EBW2268535.1 hypothetical protein [Salmonella enterica subsp. enterica serovar Hillingdon]ECB6312626.1 hypothetical protein [Salmonella enterica subsp. enterica serovar Chailey]EDR0865655.1 hypothetical protein [Salmonella enterica subsp. enterica serovar Hillingdon]EDR6326947.1 hypothetical protein [Salmonella enterica subsp. enterica serovar Hillingdon]EFO5895650.1 hypothetical protein [Salmonella enterica]
MYYKDFILQEIQNPPVRFIKSKTREETKEELFGRIKEWMREEKLSDNEIINVETLRNLSVTGYNIESRTTGFRLWIRDKN